MNVKTQRKESIEVYRFVKKIILKLGSIYIHEYYGKVFDRKLFVELK